MSGGDSAVTPPCRPRLGLGDPIDTQGRDQANETEVGLKIGSAMTLRAVVLSFALLLTVPLFAREKTDVIVMKNGDRWTCEIKELNAGVLSVGLDYVDGTVSVQWSKVARLESNQLFLVRTQNGLVYTGKLATAVNPSSQPVQINIAEAGQETMMIDRSQIVRMEQGSDRFWRRFDGDINFGIGYSKGNQTTQYNLGTVAEYPREHWAAQATFNSNLSSSSGTATSTRNQLELQSYHLLPDNYFYKGIGEFLQSSVQGIRLQTTLGGGIGHFIKYTNHMTMSVLGGVAWQNTDYKQSGAVPQGTENTAAALFGAELRVFRFKKTKLDVTAMLLPALSDPGHVVYDTNATYYLKLFSNLSWNASFYGNWNNRPPPTFAGSNYGTSSGLSWTFGNK